MQLLHHLMHPPDQPLPPNSQPPQLRSRLQLLLQADWETVLGRPGVTFCFLLAEETEALGDSLKEDGGSFYYEHLYIIDRVCVCLSVTKFQVRPEGRL